MLNFGPCYVCNVPAPEDNAMVVTYKSLPKIPKSKRNKCHTCNGNRYLQVPEDENFYYSHFLNKCDSCKKNVSCKEILFVGDKSGNYNVCKKCHPEWEKGRSARNEKADLYWSNLGNFAMNLTKDLDENFTQGLDFNINER